MRYKKNMSGRKDEQGIIIALVAVFMLAVVGAMAALSIDVVTLYTARSEAQLAADAAALAGARVLANSGMTSASDATVGGNAVPLAITVATQVAANNQVGGRNLIPGGICPGQEICANIPQTSPDFVANPQVTVQVQRTDLPTFFARIWGRTTITVKASATAEAYNPSFIQGTPAGPGLPVAPMCVKPWLLPNISPTPAGGQIFIPSTGAIADTTLLGWETVPGKRLRTKCSITSVPPGTTDCLPASANTPAAWQYYPGTTDATGVPVADFPAPSASSVACTGCTGFNDYQLSIAGCVQTPIACNSAVHIDQTPDGGRDADAALAVDGLTHSTANEGDSIDTAAPVGGPFQFVAGGDNPVVLSGAVSAGKEIMVSDSLVTVPVIDTANWPTGFPSVQIIGFVQLFLNPTGQKVPGSNHIHTKVINLVGCGTPATGGATGQPILGNGASPVAVRLISPP